MKTSIKNKSFSAIIWGFALIFAAVLLILNGMHIDLGVEISPWRIVLGVLLLAWIATLCVKLRFTDLFFPVAFLFLVFEGPIANALGRPDGNLINDWIVLLAALLLTIGFKAVFLRSKAVQISTGDSDNDSGDRRTVSGKIGGSTIYFDGSDLSNAVVKDNLGSIVVYISGKDRYEGNGMITVTDNLGTVTIHIPSEWDVVVQSSDNLGRVTVPEKTQPGEKTISLVITDNLGGITVVYD